MMKRLDQIYTEMYIICTRQGQDHFSQLIGLSKTTCSLQLPCDVPPAVHRTDVRRHLGLCDTSTCSWDCRPNLQPSQKWMTCSTLSSACSQSICTVIWKQRQLSCWKSHFSRKIAQSVRNESFMSEPEGQLNCQFVCERWENLDSHLNW